ncbi:ABC transporter permease [Paenibacillus durus]|uniref:ABC transporter permease n=1 Tax=Paenibacillus durus TaxID=44251 RepID=UPI000694380A|nr:ABC-2 family transporter protein [Paenibacillus durus]
MKIYLKYGMKSFSNQLVYRSEVWLRLLGNFFVIFIQAAIWKAVIGLGGTEGYTIQQMVTYSIINILIYALLLNSIISNKVDKKLKTGDIALELIKPLSYSLYLLADGLGNSIYQLLFTVIPSLIIALFFFGMLPPASEIHLIAFFITLLIAVMISFYLGYLISLIAFWLLNHFALSWTLDGLIILFSGSFLPLWFFPSSWANVAQALPFQYLGYIPAAMYLGTIPSSKILIVLFTGIGWTGVLFLIVQCLWWRAVKRLVVQGG